MREEYVEKSARMPRLLRCRVSRLLHLRAKRYQLIKNGNKAKLLPLC